ncbi:uncharacterized protein ARMOST_19304 [Armillaria ostoyae]|uniref:Uncharacterized protein n=1 Tax=Armillaria ostoyae TaxID=47428 RepID=A0A284S466_ARMOS|nr:uncharacterized protein ARMOST_19304 [Armillaria ostoyae]
MSETDPIDPLQLGDETVVVGDNGKTAMEELWEEYNIHPRVINPETGETSNALSTAYRIEHYGSYDLQAIDVEAHEYERFSNQPRYTLRPLMFRAVQATIDELQAALAIAATMTPSPARSMWFQVNPKDMFMSILKGSNKIQLVNAAWKGLSGRLKRGHEFLQKYLEEFERHTCPVSPFSTVPELYEYLDTEEDTEQ